MIEQIVLSSYIDDSIALNCFSPTVVFSQGAPFEIAQSNSAVIVSATGLSTLDFAFSKTQRPAGGAFLGGGRTADREIVLTIRPGNIYDAKTTLNQMIGIQHRSLTDIKVLYDGEWFKGSGYISKIEGALFDKDLDIKITFTMGDPLFYGEKMLLVVDGTGNYNTGGYNAVTYFTVPSAAKNTVLYRSPCRFEIKFGSAKKQLAQLQEIRISSSRGAYSIEYIKHSFSSYNAEEWAKKAEGVFTPTYTIDAFTKYISWTPESLNYSDNGNTIQKADRSLAFPYLFSANERFNVSCVFRTDVRENLEVKASYIKTRSGF